MNAPETPLRARIVAELEKVESSTAKRLVNLLGLESQPSLVLVELHALEQDGMAEHGTKRGSREPWYFLTNKLSPAAQAAPQPAVGNNTGSAVSGTTTPEGRAVAEETPEPESAKTPSDEGSGGNVWLSPEMQYLAPEDYELPPADPALLASANRMLQERLDGVAHVLRGSGLPGLADVSSSGDLQMHAAALSGAYQILRADYKSAGDILGEITGDFDSPRALWQLAQEAQDKINGLIAELAIERQAREALQEQINAQVDDPAVDVKDAARGYLVRAPKRRPRIVTKAETAVAAAMAAARNGSGRGDVFALVPIGSARRGAEWHGNK